jgi:hypothetical protein
VRNSIRCHSEGAAAPSLCDAGSAFMTVMATTSILFVLATTLMMMVTYQTQTTSIRTARVRATHAADAGLNAYLYEYRRAGGYIHEVPDTGVVTIGDGESYRVRSVEATAGRQTTLYSTGAVDGSTVTIAATVRYPSFADFMFLSDASILIGNTAVITGQVHSNHDIDNSGHITGKVTAAGSIVNTGRMDQEPLANQAPISFDNVGMDMVTIMDSAIGNNAFFGPSGQMGYRAVVSGRTVTVSKVTGGTTTGVLSTTPVRSLTIPPSGTLYFADTVWISGNYSVPLTIVSNGTDMDKRGNIYVMGDYVPTDPNSRVTGGLIAKLSIIVPAWYPSVPDQMRLTAALLAKTGSITADMKQGVYRESIVINGSETYFGQGGFALVSGSTVVGGFRNRTYSYDQRLDDYAPPYYPVIQDGKLIVETWVEDNAPPN